MLVLLRDSPTRIKTFSASIAPRHINSSEKQEKEGVLISSNNGRTIPERDKVTQSHIGG